MNDETPPSSASRVRAGQLENAFPTPPREKTPDPSTRLNGRLSPAPGRMLNLQRAQSTPPELSNETQLHRISRAPMGDLPDALSLEESWSRLHLSKKRSQYYSDAFAYREPSNTAKERVVRDSTILAEVKLNCCLDSEQEFLIDLSFRLSEIYQRPESCIIAMVATDIPMIMGGSFEPAYSIIIAALTPEIAATKNKRSAHLIQQFMHETLSINPKRGLVRYEAVAEANLATNGMTVLQEIEQLERQSHEEDTAFRALSRQKSRRSKRMSNFNAAESIKTPTPTHRAVTPLPSETQATKVCRSTAASGTGRWKMKHRKSIFGIFRRRSVEGLKE
ncbi:uncharacterized protein HMPREF1541_00647 [Cyphellophora europaea CBS 101466]|uniref:L-dopachrome isomerase n=1 Tax=Cyphellophora europaea (strain CBS 101466) TaxID=1220924 RepID=W2SCP2_CYPE1|nr:uncharacterized protein HMPREF1541_00647 [Cyphellophora europaea CBS 101466]ETN46462.1 hypothetical protein HMPREF1541_00647 [Cyphellophora europaea CBS 101466]